MWYISNILYTTCVIAIIIANNCNFKTKKQYIEIKVINPVLDSISIGIGKVEYLDIIKDSSGFDSKNILNNKDISNYKSNKYNDLSSKFSKIKSISINNKNSNIKHRLSNILFNSINKKLKNYLSIHLEYAKLKNYHAVMEEYHKFKTKNAYKKFNYSNCDTNIYEIIKPHSYKDSLYDYSSQNNFKNKNMENNILYKNGLEQDITINQLRRRSEYNKFILSQLIKRQKYNENIIYQYTKNYIRYCTNHLNLLGINLRNIDYFNHNMTISKGLNIQIDKDSKYKDKPIFNNFKDIIKRNIKVYNNSKDIMILPYLKSINRYKKVFKLKIYNKLIDKVILDKIYEINIKDLQDTQFTDKMDIIINDIVSTLTKHNPKGYIIVNTESPSNAKIIISKADRNNLDDIESFKYIAKSGEKKELSIGEYIILISKEGYKSKRIKVYIEKGRVKKLYFNLQPIQISNKIKELFSIKNTANNKIKKGKNGKLKIITIPKNARVFTDIYYEGLTPIILHKEYGPHYIRIEKEGFKNEYRKVFFEKNDQKLNLILQKGDNIFVDYRKSLNYLSILRDGFMMSGIFSVSLAIISSISKNYIVDKNTYKYSLSKNIEYYSLGVGLGALSLSLLFHVLNLYKYSLKDINFKNPN